MAKNQTPFRRDRKPLASPVPEIVEAAAAAAVPNAADAIVAPPVADAPTPAPTTQPAPEAEGAATEPAFAMTPATPLAAAAEAVASVADIAVPAQPARPVGWSAPVAPLLPPTLAQAGEAYLHAWLDCQREAAQFLDRQLEYGRQAQRRLSECDDAAEAARIQRDWSTEALKACLDEAASLPVLAAKFWTIGLSQLAAGAKAAAAP